MLATGNAESSVKRSMRGVVPWMRCSKSDAGPVLARRSSHRHSRRHRNQSSSSDTSMTSPAQAAFIETREYRRFVEFCDSCCRYRYIGLCYGAPGVGKTLSARHYADWDRVAFADPYADRGVFRTDEVPGNGCVFYTATVVNSPRQIEDDIASAPEDALAGAPGDPYGNKAGDHRRAAEARRGAR